MSNRLYWRPIPVNPTLHGFEAEDETNLRYKLAERYCGHDGSIRAEFAVDHEAVAFLEGMAVMGSKAAEELLAVLAEHGEVLIVIDE